MAESTLITGASPQGIDHSAGIVSINLTNEQSAGESQLQLTFAGAGQLANVLIRMMASALSSKGRHATPPPRSIGP